MITLTDLPFPPTVNNLYITLRSGKRAPSGEYQKFRRRVKKWVELHGELLLGSSQFKELSNLMQMQHYRAKLQLDLTFFCNTTKIICKDGRTKRFDTSNRVKAIEDAISDIIKIDDKHVWRLTAEKKETKGESYVEASISVIGAI